MLGIDGLSRQLRATSDLPIGAQVQILLARLAASPGELHDDATLLAINDRHAAASRSSGDAARMEAQPPVEGEVLAEVTAAARPDRLRLLRQVVGEAAGLSGFGADIAAQIVLAVDEACQNVIRHAYRGEPDGLSSSRCAARSDELQIAAARFRAARRSGSESGRGRSTSCARAGSAPT